MPTAKKPNKKPVSVRLPKHVIPSRYEIMLHPDLEAHTFGGTVAISVMLEKPVSEITLHSSELDISSASISFGKKTLAAEDISYDESSETVTFRFGERVSKGKAKLSVSFAGILKDNMRGFYKSRYLVNGEERFMATTQFEATDARRCIPCFDEPAQKAVFDVSIAVAPGKTAISNTLPVGVREHESGYKIVSFAPTPKMSTYLLAFIIGDFEWIEQKSSRGVLVRVLAVPGKIHQAKFALETTVRCLEFYEKYFDIPYPLDTLDMIAIPDFASLAMENWGAITFREIGLLVDEQATSTDTKEQVAEVIAHELAHQWFGNLVTMEWWTHLWLNEGFASYVPYLALSELFPEWDIWDGFLTYTLPTALKLDALRHTHPIEIDVHHPNEIGEIFDAVSYNKGATVIRMLAEYIGEKHFRDGLRHYLKKHSYKNASTVHLWEAFEKVSKKPVRKMMAIWTGKPGYPYISVSESGKGLRVEQGRFFSSSQSAKGADDKTVWPIPLSVTTESGEQRLDLMTKRSVLVSKPSGEWFKFNAHEGSMYRTRYEGELLGRLIAPVSSRELASADRLGIIRDLFAFAESGQGSVTTALDMLRAYENETEHIVWAEIVSGLRYIANLMHGRDSYAKLETYVQGILAGAVARLGFDPKDGESHNDTMLRPLILGAASYFGDKKVVAEAQRRFAARDIAPINPDVRGIVYVAVVRNGGEKEYETIKSMYLKETLHEEQNRLLSALGAPRNKKLLARTLDFALGEAVRMQDKNGAIASVLVNPAGKDIGWTFLKKNWKKIGDMYGVGNHLLSRLISVLNRHTTREAYTDIKAFFKKNAAPAAERTVDQTLEHIDSNIRWLARDGKKIEKWLAENA